MISGTSWRCLECALRTYAIRLEGNPLLAIASQQLSFTSRRTFTSTPKRASKIGKAPLSIPPGVTFEIIPPTRSKRKRNGATQTQQQSTAHIKGPLGTVFLIARYSINGKEAERFLQAKWRWKFHRLYKSIVKHLIALQHWVFKIQKSGLKEPCGVCFTSLYFSDSSKTNAKSYSQERFVPISQTISWEFLKAILPSSVSLV